MGSLNQGPFREQISFLLRQFLQDGGLPFTDVLSEQSISDALSQNGVCWKESIYSPLVALWVFLGQILSEDQSCASAVARLIAHRISRNQSPCSSETSAYCQARKRLPEKFFSHTELPMQLLRQDVDRLPLSSGLNQLLGCPLWFDGFTGIEDRMFGGVVDVSFDGEGMLFVTRIARGIAGRSDAWLAVNARIL